MRHSLILTPCVAGGKSEINHLGQACGSGVREDQDHLGLCSGYSDLMQGRDLASDTELVEFYSLVMERRKTMGWDYFVLGDNYLDWSLCMQSTQKGQVAKLMLEIHFI